jgi:hypothetical protein
VTARSSSQRDPQAPRFLRPLPHPLDYDWRFTSTARELLLSHLRETTWPGSAILVLGAPTLYHHGREKLPFRHWHLLDIQDPFSHVSSPAERTSHLDLLHDEPGIIPAMAAVLDPPWYPEHLRRFLSVAAQATTPQGHVYLSLPPLDTRPGIAAERRELIHDARRIGLKLTDLQQGVLPYVTPFFEYNAQRAAGRRPPSPTWRRGDLAIFLRAPGRWRHERPQRRQYRWTEIMIQDVRIRVRTHCELPLGTAALHSIVPGDILPSVSRRDPRRTSATVWTSGNRIFTCDAPARLALVARALANRYDALGAGRLEPKLSRRALEQRDAFAMAQLDVLVQQEHAEFQGYEDWLANAGPRKIS